MRARRIGVAALAMIAAASVAMAHTSCAITLAQYAALRVGMPYADAVAVLGCRGEVRSSDNFRRDEAVDYGWSGVGDLGASMEAEFENGRLVWMTQFGLRQRMHRRDASMCADPSGLPPALADELADLCAQQGR